MHIADLVAHAHKFQNEAILLIHFSPRCADHGRLCVIVTRVLKRVCKHFVMGPLPSMRHPLQPVNALLALACR